MIDRGTDTEPGKLYSKDATRLFTRITLNWYFRVSPILSALSPSATMFGFQIDVECVTKLTVWSHVQHVAGGVGTYRHIFRVYDIDDQTPIVDYYLQRPASAINTDAPPGQWRAFDFAFGLVPGTTGVKPPLMRTVSFGFEFNHAGGMQQAMASALLHVSFSDRAQRRDL